MFTLLVYVHPPLNHGPGCKQNSWGTPSAVHVLPLGGSVCNLVIHGGSGKLGCHGGIHGHPHFRIRQFWALKAMVLDGFGVPSF